MFKFKYHPNLYQNNILEKDIGLCECCQKEVSPYYHGIYAVTNVDCLCLNCIADGSAPKKFNGSFIQDAEIDKVSDPKLHKELFERTPGYISWQGKHWLACCNDFGAYLGTTGTQELEFLNIADVVFAEYELRNEYQNARDYLVKDGDLCGYLFQCLHCHQYHLYVDAN